MGSNFFHRFHVGRSCAGWKCTCFVGRVFLFSRTLLTTMLSSFTLNRRRIPTLPPPKATTRTQMMTSGKTPRGKTLTERPGAVAELQCTVREAPAASRPKSQTALRQWECHDSRGLDVRPCEHYSHPKCLTQPHFNTSRDGAECKE